MKHTYILFLIALFAVKQETYAQGYVPDAIRYSQYDYSSSARILGMGNAQTAIGGDISSIWGNPAGLGLLTKSQFAITPELNINNTSGLYYNQNTEADRRQFGLNNIGVVFNQISKPKGLDLTKGLINFSIGIGYGKVANFNNEIRFSGINSETSIANFYADLANDEINLVNGSLADAAYKGYLINSVNNTYVSAVPKNSNQSEKLIRRGGLNEFNLGLGLNFSNKLFIGGNIGILSLRYTSDNIFTETGTLEFTQNQNTYNAKFNNTYTQQYKATGYGFNTKLGIIYRPDSHIRLGANFQTPNYYKITDQYSEDAKTKITDDPYYDDQEVKSAIQNYDPLKYNLKTPAKISLGIALLDNKIGLISADVDFLDYSSINLEESDYDPAKYFQADNSEISNTLKNAMNYKLGAELKLSPIYQLRGGYSIMQSPYEDTNENLDIKTFSVGAGYRKGNTSLDFAYLITERDNSIKPYITSSKQPIAAINNKRTGLYLTLTTKF